MQQKLAVWKTAGMYAKAKPFKAGKDESSGAWAEFVYDLPGVKDTPCTVTYRALPGGAIQCVVSFSGIENMPVMPEFSLMLGIDARYCKLRWYGLGPCDSYADTLRGAKLGIYESTAAESLKKFIVPQESGNKCGVRWFEVADERGSGIRIDCPTPLEISALPYNPHQIEAFDHPNKLPDVYETILRISQAKMGVAGDDSWGAPVHPEYCLPSDIERRFEFYITPIM
jgi:beta-galactosidase